MTVYTMETEEIISMAMTYNLYYVIGLGFYCI